MFLRSLTDAIVIEGKTLRRSHDEKNGKSAIHMVNAGAVPELLEVLELAGYIVTIDGAGCQKEIAAKIIQKIATVGC